MSHNPLTKAVAIAFFALGLTACGGGGGGSSSASTSTTTSTNSDGEVLSSLTTGYSLPSELSAVPTDSASNAASMRSLLRSFAAALTDLPADSDYHKAKTSKYVEERALEQFDIIEEVLGAMAQTNYADPDNINTGPYEVLVAWEEERDGREIKELESWIVESRMIVEEGQDVNRLLAWIEEEDMGETQLIKAEFKIYQAATIGADGSVQDYGEWDMNVSFNDAGTDFFVASARIEDGRSVIKVNEQQSREEMGMTVDMSTRGIMHRSANSGFGQVEYMDWDACWQGGPEAQNPCEFGIPTATVSYAYNEDYLALQPEGENVIYKDRNNTVEMTHRYGLFNGTTGANLEKSRSFGFPITFENSEGFQEWGYYGAWQGRHELWGGQDGQIPAGTLVTREDHRGDAPAETYRVADPFPGTLTLRSLETASLTDIQGIPVEVWINDHTHLTYSQTDGDWMTCTSEFFWGEFGPECGQNNDQWTAFTDFSPFVYQQDQHRKWIHISSWDPNSQMHTNYVYLDANHSQASSGAGFYEASFDNQTGQLMPSGAKLTPVDGMEMFLDIGGSVYIQYNGTSFVEKELIDFDEDTWTPEFGENDTAFNLEPNFEYYINTRGASYVVKTDQNGDVARVAVELQSAVNPVNAASVLPSAGVTLRMPWDDSQVFSFDTNPESETYMSLIYAAGDQQGQAVDSGQWGLHFYTQNGDLIAADGSVVATDSEGFPMDPTVAPLQLNWEYAQNGGWGAQTFLVDSNGDYVLLSDPIRLSSFEFEGKTLALQFDGWLHGLPDMHWELQKNNWVMTEEIANKAVNLPAGTEVTDANSNELYYIKPLEMSVFLTVLESAPAGAPDITQATSADLNDLPTFQPHGMGAMPTDVELRYSEGLPVEE